MDEDKDKAPYDPRVPPEMRPLTQLAETLKEAQRLNAIQNPPHISVNLQLLNLEELEQIAILLKKLRERKLTV